MGLGDGNKWNWLGDTFIKYLNWNGRRKVRLSKWDVEAIWMVFTMVIYFLTNSEMLEQLKNTLEILKELEKSPKATQQMILNYHNLIIELYEAVISILDDNQSEGWQI